MIQPGSRIDPMFRRLHSFFLPPRAFLPSHNNLPLLTWLYPFTLHCTPLVSLKVWGRQDSLARRRKSAEVAILRGPRTFLDVSLGDGVGIEIFAESGVWFGCRDAY